MDYEVRDEVAVLTFDDGKANAVSHAFLDGMNDGLDRAAAEAKTVLVVGREGMFSGGFDLNEIGQGPDAAEALVGKGARTLLRLFSHPQPVVMACTGHAIAAGAFLLLTADSRIGGAGDFKIGLNETLIGMTIPVFGQELARCRLNPRQLTRAFVQAHLYDPDDAVPAGFLDRVLPMDQVVDQALAEAVRLTELAGEAYAGNKRNIRAAHIAAIEASLA